MRKRNLSILPLISCFLAAPAFADWQYSGVYVGDGWYEDDGSRFVISVRGGASFGMASIENKVGGLATELFVGPNGEIETAGWCEQVGCDWPSAGYVEWSELPADKELETFSFAAGASVGWTVPNKPQWRFEAGWDHVTKSDYNASPMFSGNATIINGTLNGEKISLDSGAVNSEITTDVISIMAFYDFYSGIQKPSQTFIPYLGFGLGYADTKTVLNLSDPYGDMSYQGELAQYGEIIDGAIEFYKSESSTSNVAGLLAAGVSYGITESMYFDFGGRIMYIPRVKWELSNEDASKHREFFDAENLMYVNIMLGLRFEF